MMTLVFGSSLMLRHVSVDIEQICDRLMFAYVVFNLLRWFRHANFTYFRGNHGDSLWVVNPLI